MIHYLVLVKIKDAGLFAKYVNGHLPSIVAYGGKITFRSIENYPVLGQETWDVVVIQEWPSESAFDIWWNSEEYQPWAKIRDDAASLSIIKCLNLLQS